MPNNYPLNWLWENSVALARSGRRWLLVCVWILGICSTALGEDARDRSRPIRAYKDVVYAQVDGVNLLADIYRPADDSRRAAILMLHGGAWSSGTKWNLSDHAREMAQAGYVAVAIDYRLAPTVKYPGQLLDCLTALEWLVGVAEEYQLDPQRIAAYGYSAGGQLAAMLATRPPDNLPKIRAALLGGAPCDFSFIPEQSRILAHVMGGTRAQIPDVYRDASPVTFASMDDCPMFFFHGSADWMVPIASSRRLYELLNNLGVETRYHTVEDQGHLVTFIHPGARRAAIEFLKQHLPQEP